MGCFSWKFADTDNTKRLRIDCRGFLFCPNGDVLKASPYDGYGHFDGLDVFDLVADWNRVYLNEHPEFIIAKAGESTNLSFGPCKTDMRADACPWYEVYADLTKTREEVVDGLKQKLTEMGKGCSYVTYRNIGIDMADSDRQNVALPYPIKICQVKNCGKAYKDLPASERDLDHGLGLEYHISRPNNGHKDIESDVFRAVVYDDAGAIEKESDYDTLKEAVAFAEQRHWDAVIDPKTGKRFWSK